jgi:tRNA 2-selenouridine synthase
VSVPLLDVRSPAEYARGHVPRARSVPLLSDAAHADTGAVFAREGRAAAAVVALAHAGPALSALAATALGLVAQRQKRPPPALASSGEALAGNGSASAHSSDASAASVDAPQLLVTCARGGMRSASVAWLLSDVLGVRVATLEGGYKAYRAHVLASFAAELPIALVGGATGSGKTRVLASLRARGEAVVDLERLAAHAGSVFGAVSRPHFQALDAATGPAPDADALLLGHQPSQEAFENMLFDEIDALRPRLRSNSNRRGGLLWLEDEARTVGRRGIPPALLEQMRLAPVHLLQVPLEQRVRHALDDYAGAPPEALVAGTRRLAKRLGHERAKEAERLIMTGDLEAAARTLLAYYDRAYQLALLAKKKSSDAVVALAPTEGGGNERQRLFDADSWAELLVKAAYRGECN